MKLAEALARRGDLQTKFRQLQFRATMSAVFQEGDQPAEDPLALLAESDQVAAELEALITAINRTNLATRLGDGTTVTAALARRDTVKMQHSFAVELADAGAATSNRQTRSEIKMVSAVDVRELRRKADALSAELRRLETRLQEVNWTADLVVDEGAV